MYAGGNPIVVVEWDLSHRAIGRGWRLHEGNCRWLQMDFCVIEANIKLA